MLVYFKVGNFKSIKEPVIINFNATSIGEHQDTNVFKRGKDSLLRTVLLYGPNAGGKSKILDALAFFRWSVINSATDKQSDEEINTEAFALNTVTVDQPSYFEAEFIIDKTKYRYGFEADKEAVRKEWLMEVKATTDTPLFLRIGQEFQIDNKKFKDGEGLGKRTRRNALFLSVAAQWNVQKAEEINKWFKSIITIHGMMDRNFRDASTKMLRADGFNELINEFIRKADLGIQSLHVIDIPDKLKEEILDEVPSELKDEYAERFRKNANPIMAMHEVYNEEGKIVNHIPFNLDMKESEGTQKFFNLAGVFIDSILKGKLVVIDELDARMHTLLSKAVIHLYNSKELKSEAQLLAVSHDTALLDRDLLRRDQICFVEKDKFGASKVATLVEYKVRKETPYDKNYLEGKYGAIPFVENFETILDNGEEKQ